MQVELRNVIVYTVTYTRCLICLPL